MAITHDVFLSYSSRDKPVVRDLARRLRDAGLRVWFDEWELAPGDSIPNRIEAGLTGSAVLVLCMSRHALGSDWTALESQTFRFRDPVNTERRFVPLRLDDEEPRGSLAQFLYVDWRARSPTELERLVRACGPVGARSRLAPAAVAVTLTLDHPSPVNAVACHPDGTRALTASADRTVREWDLATATCERILEGHTGEVNAVAYHPDGTRALSASADRTARLWDLTAATCEQILEGHTGWARAVAWHPDGAHALSASADGTVRLWHLATATCRRTVDGHAVACQPDGARALTASADRTVREWDLATATCRHILEGHTGQINAVAYHPSSTRALSASADGTVREWDLATATCRHVLEGHAGAVSAVAYGPDGTHALSASADGTVLQWDLTDAEDGAAGRRREPRAQPPLRAVSAARITYTNAKVVLVGESQAGKSGLAMRLAHGRWELTESTVGAWATQLKIGRPAAETGGHEREIWLWDFGGQADQRLIHQLYLGDAALAVLVFDGQREDAIARLWEWQRVLACSGVAARRILVAGRTDANPVRLSRSQIEDFREAAGFDVYLETSAKDDIGCRELRDAIVAAIDWRRIPHRSSPAVFKRLKDAILALKDSGRALTSVKELRDLLPARVGAFAPTELDAVIGLLARPGAILPLRFGDYVLLRPELLNAYAQAVIRSLRDDPQERGCIAEERVLAGELSYPPDFARLPEGDEHVVLHAMHRQLVQRSICQRIPDPRAKTTLVFPSYYRRERPDRPASPPQSFMTYRFAGHLDEVYASLVGRMHHAQAFGSPELWRGAADFQTPSRHAIGIRLTARSGGTGELELHCDGDTPVGEQVLFARYVHDHLLASATDVVRLRTYICPRCGTPVENRDAARRRMREGKVDIACSYCDARIALWDEIERELDSEGLEALVQEMRELAERALDEESARRLLVGEVLAVTARAGQLARELPAAGDGIDMEIEFIDDEGNATGRKLDVLLLLLNARDSLRRPRAGDAPSVVAVRDAWRVDRWADAPVPVMLVVRDSSGAIEWMEIGEHLRAERAAGRWPAHEIAFEGERLDVMSIRRRRERALRA